MDAAKRLLRLDAERLRVLLPPVGVLARLEHVREFGRRLEPLVPVLREQLVDDLLEERRELRVDLGHAARGVLHHGLHHAPHVLVLERVLAAGEFVEHEAERVEVGAVIHLAPALAELLGRGVVERPHERARLAEPDRLVGEPRDAEVHHLDLVRPR